MQFVRGPWLLVLMTMAFLVPNHYEPWLSFHQEALAFAAFLLLVWRRPGLLILNPYVLLGFALLAASPLLQFVCGQTALLGDALSHTFFISAAAAVAISGYTDAVAHPIAAGARARNQPAPPIQYLLAAILVGGMVSVGLLLHQWLALGLSDLFINSHPQGSRPYANLAQPNHVSLLLAMSMVVVWWLWECRRIGAFGAWLATVWLLGGAALTDSRAFLLGATAFLVVFALFRKRCGFRTSILALLMVAAVFVLMVKIREPIHETLLLSVPGARGMRVESIQARALIWTLLIQSILDKPWFGYGWGMVAFAQLQYAASLPGSDELFFSSHNWLLDLMVFMGIPVALLITVCGLLWFIKASERIGDAKGVAVLLMPVLVMAYSTVEFQFSYAYFLLPAVYCAGWVLSAGTDSARRPLMTQAFTSKAVTAGTWAVVALGVLIAFDYWKFEQVWQRERFVIARIDPNGYRPPFDPYVLTNLKGMLDLERASMEHLLDDVGLKRVEEIAARYPYIPFVLKWAWALKSSGRGEESRQLVEAVCAREGQKRCTQIRQAVSKW